MKHIFIDTNIFLHFEDFENIDWLEESSSEICKIIILPIVVDELDEKKIGTSKISNRARKTLQRFEELSEMDNAKIRENVFFELFHDKPENIVYEENNLNYLEQDHRLIASILLFREKHQIEAVELCTHDVGPRLRAKKFGIGILKLNDKYLLPNQLTEEEKKIKKLEEEVRNLKNRIPNLSLKFENEKEFIEFEIKKFNIIYEEFRIGKINEIKTQYPYLIYKESNPYDNPALLFALDLNSPTSEQIDGYNKRLAVFYAEYEKKLTELFEYEKRKKIAYNISFSILNSGNSPAEDIDLHLYFPDGFEVVETTEIEKAPDLPIPPRKPESRFEGILFPIPGLHNLNNILDSNININYNKPKIKKTNSYEVNYHRKKLKHECGEHLEPLSIIFRHFNNIKSFHIDYIIRTDNIPKSIEGKLFIKFIK